MGRSPGGGQGNPLRYSGLENPHGQRSLVGYSPWGRTELDTTDNSAQLQLLLSLEKVHTGNHIWYTPSYVSINHCTTTTLFTSEIKKPCKDIHEKRVQISSLASPRSLIQAYLMLCGQGQPQGVRRHHTGGTQIRGLTLLGVPAEHIMLTKDLRYYHIRNFQLATFSFSFH